MSTVRSYSKTMKYVPDIYKCANCAIPFNKRKAFMRHIKHRKNRCSNCCRQASPNNPTILFKPLINRKRSETITWHLTNEIERVECQDCQWECFKLDELDNFDRLSKTVADGHYFCDLCSNKYLTKHQLAEHIRLHTGDRPYRCTVCNKSFYYDFNLRAHRKYHQSIQLYQCIYCLKNCARKWVTIDLIIQSFVNINRNACEVCYKTADELDTLAKRYTSGPKAHGCIWCSRQFATAYSWIKHVYKKHLFEQSTQKNPVLQLQNTSDPPSVYRNETTTNETTANETITSQTTANETITSETTASETITSETTASETAPQQAKYLCKHCGLRLTEKYLMRIHKKIHLDVTKLNWDTSNRFIDDFGNLHTNYETK